VSIVCRLLQQAVNPRAIRNKVKIASSTKRPRYPVYEEGGRIVWIKPGQEASVFGTPGEEASAQQQQQQPAELKVTVTEA
jgi:large subunit ribosomal protein L28